ncbi:heme lyase CcmF/NrfE family subunit [Pelagibius sp. Alg239-R121]|uniref:heme lyase CcmF/NrfE family subunit n=1 Tax=Pelagibius sp. Alg239-R121 TaxID=2993448 RepID=UPI0024A7126D|nr:heme lyase CcmF/NrfE family subunit [Pelagibius sp. Alg239-R121]
MSAEIGQFALILALLVSMVQSSLPMIGAAKGNSTWIALSRPSAILLFALIVLAFAALTQAFVTSDFSVATVFRNSHSAKPMLYKISGVWGNHEGSMLLWVLILTGFGAAVAGFGKNLPPTLQARVLSVQAMITLGFLAFLIFTSNPFERMFPAPLDGRDLNPLLQDPGLAFHPPMLYAGYVGFSIAFSFAVAALIEGKVDAAWARWVRPWTLAAWITLTAGIALGSWWAYYELGWGGWWFWDPVENVSFMPWLMGTALLHSAIVVEKRDSLKVWTILLAILTFSLSLIGTFIVRSGLLTSVHAFATDPERGLFILVLLAIAIGGSLLLFALRAPALTSGGLFSPISREGGLVLNNLLLTVATFVVFVGTLGPLLLEATGTKISVGTPYYNAVFVPLMVPLVAVMAVGPMMPWKRAELGAVLSRLKFAGFMTVVAVLVTAYLQDGGPVLAIAAIGFAAWLFVGALVEWAERVKLFRLPLADSLNRAIKLPRAAHGMTLAHAGMAVAIAGMTGSAAWKTEDIRITRPGETIEVAGYSYLFEGLKPVEGPNYRAEEGTFIITKDGEFIAKLTPQRRLYNVQNMPTTEAGIHTTGLEDLYVVVGDPDGRGGWTTRIYHEPLVPWIWAGCLIMVLGGTVSLSDRRLRVGAPVRSKRWQAKSGTGGLGAQA